MDEFLADLRTSVAVVTGMHTDDRSTTYAAVE
jgi:hypothetical protein